MSDSPKNPAAVALGRLGAKKGGLARAANMTKREREEAAARAGNARWAKQRAAERRQKRIDAAVRRKAKAGDADGAADTADEIG